MEELFQLQILTNIWELRLSVMLNEIYIYICIQKYMNVLRKLICKLFQKNLEKLYLLYFRPILNNCDTKIVYEILINWISCNLKPPDSVQVVVQSKRLRPYKLAHGTSHIDLFIAHPHKFAHRTYSGLVYIYICPVSHVFNHVLYGLIWQVYFKRSRTHQF